MFSARTVLRPVIPASHLSSVYFSIFLFNSILFFYLLLGFFLLLWQIEFLLQGINKSYLISSTHQSVVSFLLLLYRLTVRTLFQVLGETGSYFMETQFPAALCEPSLIYRHQVCTCC